MPKRILLTWRQRNYRSGARREGKHTIQAITNYLYPVFDDDEVFWLGRAIAHARSAWRYALLSEDPG